MDDIDDSDEHDDDEVEAKASALIEELGERARKVGLYLADHIPGAVQAMVIPVADGSGRLVIRALFDIGQVAWSARVQDPEQAEVDKTFREIKDADMEAEIEALRKKARERGIGVDDGDD